MARRGPAQRDAGPRQDRQALNPDASKGTTERPEGYSIVMNELWQTMPPTAVVLWCKLDLLGCKSGEAWMSRQNLARDLDRSVSALDRDLKALVRCGWIRKNGTRPGRNGAVSYSTIRRSNATTADGVSNNAPTGEDVSRSNATTSDAQTTTTAKHYANEESCRWCRGDGVRLVKRRSVFGDQEVPEQCNHQPPEAMEKAS